MSSQLPSQQRLLLLMDHSLDFVEFLGGEGLIQGVSAAIKTLGGYEPAHLIGTHYEEILHPDDCMAAASVFASILRGEQPGPVTLRYRHKDGSWRTVQATARNFLDDPAVRAVIVLTRDVTEQVNAEVSLAQANVELRRLSQQLLVAQETERNRIARELHDDVQQILVGLRMNMESSTGPRAASASVTLIGSWVALVKEAIDHLHALTVSLRPTVLGERGLATELKAHVSRAALLPGAKIHLDTKAHRGRLTPDLELACFRIVQEALSNAITHAGARNIYVALQKTGSDLSVSIRDDGAGFNVPATRAGAAGNGSIGLLSMRERAGLAGGRLDIQSSVGHGTSVCATFRTG